MTIDRLFGLAGRKALIIGTTPIGNATAALFEEAGATAEVRDVHADEAAMAEVVGGFTERHGSLDVLVYATTRIGTYALPQTSMAQWDAIHDSNLKGAFLALRETIPVMQRQGGGVIVAVSTMGSVHPVLKGNGAYGASKGGLNALVRAAALDHVGDGIRINTVLPGAVPVGPAPDDMQSMGGPAMEAGRLKLGIGSAEDVAAAILFLASPAGRFITGQALALDGGFLIS